VFTIVGEILVGFPGFTMQLAIQTLCQITMENFFLYLSVMPIIVLTSRASGGFLIGVIIAFVYGYGGMFAAGSMSLSNLYPVTASLGLIGYRSYDAAVHWNLPLCFFNLVLMVGVSAVLILFIREREPKKTIKKAKHTAYKKGW
jgi:ABC-2 type transport system permease protein